MKPIVGMAVCLLLVSCGIASADVTLVEEGKAKAAIYVVPEVMDPENKEHQRLRASVADLAHYLQRMSGAQVSVFTREPAEGDGVLPILIGSLAEKAFGPPASKALYQQGWRMVVSGKGVGLLGESDEGVSYATYELLDRLGCRWYIPGDLGECIPALESVNLPEMDFSAVPATVFRGIWYADEDFVRRNRLGGMRLATNQGMEGYLSREQLEANPDWNAEIDGKRTFTGRICWGNPEVAAAVGDSIIAMLDKQYVPSVSLSPEDGISFCQCAKCKALDAGDWDPTVGWVSITDRYIHFCNQIAERVTQKYPDVLLGMLAYVQYTRPPVREKLHPSLVPEIAPITYCRAHSMANPACPSRQELRSIVKGWAKAAKILSFYEFAYNLAEVSAPNPMMTKWSEDLPILYSHNVKFWHPETLTNFDSVLPGLYLGIRMSWYATADPQQILDEFFTRFYGAAAEPMRRYWTIFDDAWSKVPDHAGCGFSYGRRFTPEVMDSARKAMNGALAACQTAMDYRRVKLADDSLGQFELFMKMRWDYFEGRLANLESDSNRWLTTWASLAEEHKAQYAFSPYGASHFSIFWLPAYQDGARIARDFAIISPSIRQWRYQVDREGRGEALGWDKPGFDDSAWGTTDPCVQTWSSLGLYEYFGPMWYRTKVNVPAVPSGKKIHLWVGTTDGSCKVTVNGQPIPYVDAQGNTAPEASGYCNPFSFDVTSAVKPGAENQITIASTRQFGWVNEVGTGGLVGPVLLYRDK